MTDRILVQDLIFYGHHGVADEEQAIGGRYRVSVAVMRSLAQAGASDRLADTTSYSEVARVIVRVGTGRRFRLIEALAEAIAAELLARFPVDGVTVRVTKEHPPVPELVVGAAAVEISRRRAGGGPAPQQEGQAWW